MRVLVHLSPHAPYELLGVWCPPSDDGQLRGYYPYGGHAEEYGRSCVIDELEFRPWLKVAERLAMRTPYSAWWEAIDLPITLGLHEAFDEVLSRAEVSWTADLLAERTGLPTEPLEAGGHRLSTLFSLHADDGTLADPDTLQKHAARLLASQDSDATLHRFVDEWLHLDRLAVVPRDAMLYPELTPDIRAAMLGETHRFVSAVYRDGGTLTDLQIGRAHV